MTRSSVLPKCFIRFHQSGATPDDWQFALTDDQAPVFARRVAPGHVNASGFESLMQEALDHAGLMRTLAQQIHAARGDEKAPLVMLQHLA